MTGLDTATIVEHARAVPQHTGFPTVDDLVARFDRLAADHPDAVTVTRVGTSRLGEPIHAYRVGRGARSAVVVGGVHPNEPIGSWTALHLAQSVLTDPVLAAALDTTWHIVPTIDPDGMRLNEAWFDDPTDRVHYARHFYRPAPDAQVEWTFPTNHKGAYFDRVLPETLGLMLLIDRVRPDLLVSLHNGEMGGVYYYLSRDEPEVIATLHAVPAALGLPLDTGEPESPYLREYARSVFAMGEIDEAYDYYESLGIDPAAFIGGSSSSSWAGRHGTLSLVAELPYWQHPDADDDRATGESYADLVRRTADAMAVTGSVLDQVLDAASPMLTIATPFLEASRAFVPMLARMAETDRARADREPPGRMATVAERFGLEDLVRCFRLRYGGMLLRAIEAETTAGTAPVVLRRLRDRLVEQYATWQAEAGTGAEQPIPLAALVGVQYGAVLAAASHLARTLGPAAGGGDGPAAGSSAEADPGADAGDGAARSRASRPVGVPGGA
ncbi:M14 family zinc carboxypeptidase [Curtobacterium sp. MCBD17_019]|uniref:M14 family zinc carboxypeptidase n=1 Tax=Curtobacterium sp. MCBD17_019 TaxID=2175669 RepID=UPI000DA83723|nr:M14 family zinc carboxypeptidase [Curtobacterium sp. MCBD17_019]PZE78527.1 peptidase M14 [Curtobacterium sp. MCBD17_019]